MNRPTLKQFADLSSGDFEVTPIWIACHVVDFDEAWYDDTDEETFRPYTGSVPADSTELLLVSATATLNDGTVYPAFVTPADDAGDLAALQPHLFVGGDSYGFWGGIIGIPDERRRAFLDTCGKDMRDVFPIRFVADPALSTGVTHTEVSGWL